jgi:hypothetical protein
MGGRGVVWRLLRFGGDFLAIAVWAPVALALCMLIGVVHGLTLWLENMRAESKLIRERLVTP